MPISLHLVDKPGKPERPNKGSRRLSAREKEPFSAEAKPAEAPPAPVGGNHRVLVVDDNPVVLKAFELKLKSEGFVVTTSTNCAAVASTAEQTQAELIVLDINFPGGGAMDWNGFTVMQWLRRFPELARLPVILISGGESAEYREKALAEGAVAFFQKPVVFAEILKAMLQALPQSAPPSAK
jgi:CheY-like chemotaxis protein